MAEPLTLAELNARLVNVTTALTAVDVAPLMPAVRVMGLADQRRRFATSTAPDGTPWAPLRFPRPNGGNQPLRNFGTLAASITAKTTADTLIIGTNLVYAGVHFFGETIRPKPPNKFLTIPLTVEAMRAGGARRFPRPLVPIVRNNRGILAEVIYLGKGRGSRVIAHYVLVRSVKITERRFMGFSAEFVEDLYMLWGETLVNKMQALTGG